MLRYAFKLKGKKNMLDCQCWQTQVPEIVIRKDLTKFGSITSNQISLQTAPGRMESNCQTFPLSHPVHWLITAMPMSKLSMKTKRRK